jgi:hypothetical protein
MLNRLMGGTPRKSSELLKKELLELQTRVDTEQRELMRLQTAKRAAEVEEADRQAATVYRLHESQSDDSQSDGGQSDDSQSDDSQSDGGQSDDSQSEGGQSDGGESDGGESDQSDAGQSDAGQSEDSGSGTERRHGWPPTLEERAAAINAAVWGTSRQHTQSHPEAEQAPQPRVPRPPEQHQPQMPVQASPHRAAAEAEYRAAMAAALEAAETASRLRLESESESDNERRDSDSWPTTLEEATKATERAASINAAAWSASRQRAQAQSPPEAARAAAAPARWFQPTEPPVQPQPQPQPQPLHSSPEGKEQEQARKERVVAVVARWQQQNGPWLRTLLAALDAPELGAILGLCKSVCTKLPVGSDEGAVRRAYLRAIKRVHPDKVSAQAPAQERFAAAAIFDALREANERNESAAELPERRKRPERRSRPS